MRMRHLPLGIAPPSHPSLSSWSRGSRDYEDALTVAARAYEGAGNADRARRHRFFSALPFGGRLLSLRWILEAPVEMLDQASVLHRQDLLARYPAYAY